MQTKRAKILNASAGSGKTYQLAFQYVRDVIEEPELYRHILAVTFTNKATEEMKSRILKEIHNLAAGNDSSYLTQLSEELALDEQTIRKRAAEVRAKILHDYSRFTVLTIDTFFQRILRAFIKELGIDLNYNVEIETSSVLSKGADALIEQITVDRDLQRWLSEFVQERIDDGLKMGWSATESSHSRARSFKEKNKSALTGRTLPRRTGTHRRPRHAPGRSLQKGAPRNRPPGPRDHRRRGTLPRRLPIQGNGIRQMVLHRGRGLARTLQNPRRGGRRLGRQVGQKGFAPPATSPRS